MGKEQEASIGKGWPAVMISGSYNQNESGRGNFQELDQIQAINPFSKFSAKATHISQIPNCVAQVLYWSFSSQPEGCYLDLPSDVLHQKVSGSEANAFLIEAKNNRTNIHRDIEVPAEVSKGMVEEIEG